MYINCKRGRKYFVHLLSRSVLWYSISSTYIKSLSKDIKTTWLHCMRKPYIYYLFIFLPVPSACGKCNVFFMFSSRYKTTENCTGYAPSEEIVQSADVHPVGFVSFLSLCRTTVLLKPIHKMLSWTVRFHILEGYTYRRSFFGTYEYLFLNIRKKLKWLSLYIFIPLRALLCINPEVVLLYCFTQIS